MKKLALALVASAASLLSAGAMAQSTNFYVAGDVGAGHINYNCSGVSNCDKNDVSYKLLGGYSFGNGLALELGYASFGKETGHYAGYSIKVEAYGPFVGVAYQLPLNSRWGADFRLGVIDMTTKSTAASAGVSSSDDESHGAVYAGVGLAYALNRQLQITGGIDFSQAEYGGDDASVSSLAVGLRYKF